MSNISIFCPYCHERTALTLGALHGTKTKFGTTHWNMGTCNGASCGEVVLIRDIPGQPHLRKVFPNPLPSPTDQRVPAEIRADLDEAKTCFSVGAWRASAAMARRTIESTCNVKGATKDKLHAKIDELLAAGVITREWKEWADAVRWTGNDAAHASNDPVDSQDAEEIIHLAEQFVHMLFVTPALAQAHKGRRGKP